jgi:hypothetical protein
MRSQFVALLLLLLMPASSFAGAVINYHGRIVDNNSLSVESANVTFRIRILSPNPGKCLLYEETRTLNMTGSDGVFVIPIGDGVGDRNPVTDPGIPMEKIFSNDPALTFNTTNTPKLVCNSGVSYTPDVLHQRQLYVAFDDHSGVGEQVLPIMDLSFVPLAVNSYDSQKIGGTAAASVVRLSSGTATPLTLANFTELLSLVNGTTTQYEKAGKINGVSLPALSNGQVLGWNAGTWAAITPMTSFAETDPSVKAFAKASLPNDCGTDKFLRSKSDGSGFDCLAVTGVGSVTSVTAGTGLKNSTSPGNPITTTGTLVVDMGTAANQVVQMGADTKLPAVDGSKLTNVAAVSLSGTASINTSGTVTASSVTAPQMNTRLLYIENATPNRVTIQAPASFTNYAWTLPTTQGTSGQVLSTSGSGQLVWASGGTGSVTGVTADAPLTVDSSTASYPKVSLPKADVATNGYLDKADWDSFNKKLSSSLTTGQIWLGVANLATPVTPSKDLQVAADGKFTVKQVQGNAFSSTTLTAPDANKFYKWDGTEFVATYIGLSDLRKTNGSVQVVACPAGQIATWESVTNDTFCVALSVGGSNFAAQNMNKVFAGPVSGADAVPVFRSLASVDIPTLTLTKISDAGTAAYKNVPAAGNAGTTEVVFGTDTRLTDSRVPTDGSVTTAKIVDGNVTDAKINSLAASKLTGTVGSGNLPVAGSGASGIVNAIAQSFSGLKTFLNGLIVMGDATVSGSVTAASVTVSGDPKDIKLASQTAACDAAAEGSLKYDKATKKILFCNGATWEQMSAGAIASLLIGPPNATLVKSGPVAFDITYGSGVDPGTVTLAVGNITLGGTGTAGCSVTGITGSGNSRTVTVNGCSSTGTVNISIAAGTANSTSGDPAPAAGPSATYQVDNTGPSVPTSVTLGAVPQNTSKSPTITYTAGTDSGGSTVASHQVQIIKTSDSSVIRAWANHTSGTDISGLSLTISTQYSVLVRAVDALGNNGTVSAAKNWTTVNDLCLGSPNPGDVCLGGAVFLGTLSPGATSGSGTDKYMTTPGGCGEIPAGQIMGTGMAAYPNADFTPTCAGTDALKKYWNNGTANWFTVPGLVDAGGLEGIYGDSQTDVQYGDTNTIAIAAVTSAAQGGPHAAAAYCDKLNVGGYTDWHLPNRVELNLFFKNKASIPGLNLGAGEYYWSSTEAPTTSNSWFEAMDTGYQGYNGGKFLGYGVRCIRRY